MTLHISRDPQHILGFSFQKLLTFFLEGGRRFFSLLVSLLKRLWGFIPSITPQKIGSLYYPYQRTHAKAESDLLLLEIRKAKKKVGKIFTIFLTLLWIMLPLSGCNKRYSNLPPYSPLPLKNYANNSVGRFKSSFIVEQIEEFYQGTDPGPIGITTLVNLDDLSSTSTFGRLYSEQILSELSMRGYQVIELRHTEAVRFLTDQGEFALSRDVTTVQRMRELGAIVAGTYVVSPDRIYVNVRLIDPATSTILSVGSVEMEKTEELSKLVKGKSGTARVLERVPMRGENAFIGSLVPPASLPLATLPHFPSPSPTSPVSKKKRSH